MIRTAQVKCLLLIVQLTRPNQTLSLFRNFSPNPARRISTSLCQVSTLLYQHQFKHDILTVIYKEQNTMTRLFSCAKITSELVVH